MTRKLTREQEKAIFAKSPLLPVKGGYGVDIKVTVPSTKDVDKKLSSKQMNARVGEVVSFFNKSFGGTTRILGKGSWYSNDKKKDIHENVAVVESFANHKDFRNSSRKINDFLTSKKKEWGQESLAYTIETPEQPNETMHFV